MTAQTALCPQCNLKAIDQDGIELKFGWRETKGKTIPQSWCRRCRSGKLLEEEKDEVKKDAKKAIYSSIQSYANRLQDLDSLRNLFTKPDGLNFKYKNEELDTENWSKESQRILEKYDVGCKKIAEKDNLDIIYVNIKTNIEKDWKTLAKEIFAKEAGYCLVITHNLDEYKWLFTGSTGIENSAKHITIQIQNENAPADFVDWLYKIKAEEDDTLHTLISKVDSAFDDYAIDIQEKLGENVFNAFLKLVNEAVFNKDNKLDFDIKTLQRINDPLFALLYRLVFVLYAESREIFDTTNEKYYNDFSIKKIIIDYIKEWDKESPKIKLEKYELWTRLKHLFDLIENGSKSLKIKTTELDMPAYNGSLYNTERHPELEDWYFNNETILDALHSLTRIQDKERNWSYVNYASIEIRHIGTIYEKLLQFHPIIVGKEIKIFSKKENLEAQGTYYTPKAIVDNIIQNSLGHIVDNIIKNNQSSDEKIEKILQLKILDPSMGSGHFLVGSANYLARRIIEIDPDKSEENFIARKREVVRRCLYGVDINPLAVELAKMSLWLDTLSQEHALSFLATHLKVGDSILSAFRKDIFELQTTLDEEDYSRTHFKKFVNQYSAFETIDDHFASTVKSKIEEEKETRKPGSNYDHLKYLFDVQLSKYYGNEIEDWQKLRPKVGSKEFNQLVNGVDWKLNRQFAKQNHFFHWELEFPQVFCDRNGDSLDNGGFDVIIGNPPYGVAYSNEFYDTFGLANSESYGFFMVQAFRLVKENGIVSMVVNDTWRTLTTKKDLRKIILENFTINRLMKLSRYAFKSKGGKNVDAFTVIFEFKKQKSGKNSLYYYYDMGFMLHPIRDYEFYNSLFNYAIYKHENEDWPFEPKITSKYENKQELCSTSDDLQIFEGSEKIFQLFNKNAPQIFMEV